MDHRPLIVPLLALMLLLGASQPAGATGWEKLVEIVPGGSIDWTHWTIRATGESAASGTPMDRPQALQTALENARQNLLGAVNGIRADADHRVGRIFANNQAVVTQIEKLVENAPMVESAFLSDTAVVTVEMKMNDGFSQLVLPEEIKQIQSIKTVSTSNGDSATRDNGNSVPAPLSGPASFTGLVVDARGLELYPTMYPRIYDESGLEVYGSAFASREYSVKTGMIRYGKNIAAAIHEARVADNPLVVKGLRTTQPGHTCIVISNADASKIRASSEHLTFLKKCRVLIVVSTKEVP